ncbi:MAG TPA: TrkH family potassium uptake protein [Paracoccus sp. (in: a-proteobacteria)]|nr:TrkH family potassium uptake protein [Paracoccus sp. (in: a-proteobacteria)]
MIDIRPVVHALSKLAVAMGGLMALPMALDWAQGNANWQGFLQAGVAAVVLGGLVASATRRPDSGLTVEQAFLLTSSLWLVLPAVGALPFMLGEPGATITDAMFEAMSGMSTTGATAFVRLDGLPAGTHLWRGLLHWTGGLGIVVVAMVFMPVMRVGGMQFFRSEGFDTGGKMLPRAGSIAGQLTQVYVLLTLGCAASYAALGMPGLDAVVHAMSTCATGGFSSRDASFGAFSPAQQYAATVFTLIASLPFIRMVQLMQGDAEPIWRDSQIRAFLGIVAAITGTIVLYRTLWLGGEPSVGMLREVSFNVVTIISGTGFASSDVTQWGHLSFVLLIMAGLIGGCTGSTCCSIKVFRYQVLFQAVRAQLAQMQSPHRVQPLRLQGRRLTPEVVNSVMALFTMFLLSLAVLVVALAFTGLHPRTALTAGWTSIANVGPIWGPEVTANGGVAQFPATAKWLMILGMYLGRLELITVLVVLMPRFWRQ